MIKFKLNRKKFIPNLNEYLWIVLSATITVYLFKPIILNLIPRIVELHSFFQMLIWIFIIVYFKDLININRNGRDMF